MFCILGRCLQELAILTLFGKETDFVFDSLLTKQKMSSEDMESTYETTFWEGE